LIRVAIYADNLPRALRLAELLADDERLEIFDTRGHLRSIPRNPPVDVVLAAGLLPGDLSGVAPPVVLIAPEIPRQASLRSSIRAWLPEDALPAEIGASLVAASHGFTLLTRDQARRWLKTTAFEHEPGAFPAEPLAQEALTPRELQVLRMMADGSGNKQIAARLAISDHTAKFHVAQVLAKLRAGTRAEAVAIGIRRGLVPI